MRFISFMPMKITILLPIRPYLPHSLSPSLPSSLPPSLSPSPSPSLYAQHTWLPI